jgi:hypothetical protein
MKRIVKRSLISIGVGSFFPSIYLTMGLFGLGNQLPLWSLYIWPSALFFLATDGQEHNFRVVAPVIAISLLVNAILWALVGLGLFKVADFVKDRFARAKSD